MISVALVNLKPGVGKTTSAVWLAYALYEMGYPVLLVDADPAASALEWSDLLAEGPAGAGFPFRVAALPSKELHTRLPGIAKPGEAVVIDAPQMEDHAGIARAAMRYADEIVIPVAPAGIELARMGPVREEIENMQTARRTPARVSVLLNRVVASAASGPETREDLTDDGWHVLSAAIPRREIFAQSYGGPVKATATPYQLVAEELLKRGAAA